jgi:beige protein homolog 1
LFNSIEDLWELVSSMDVKELIPEFFYQPEFLVNLHSLDFGITQTKTKVDDVVLPLWCNRDPRFFVKAHRRALESQYVSLNLHHWINLIFGDLQTVCLQSINY